MKTTITFIFKHQHYKDIISKYQEVITEYSSAFSVWSTYTNYKRNNDFKSKEYVASNILVIKKVSEWIKKYEYLRKTAKEGLKSFFMSKGYPELPIMSYKEYKLVAEQAEEIENLQKYEVTYCQLLTEHKEAIERFIGRETSTHSYAERKEIALHKNEIQNLSSVLSKAHICETRYPQAWKYFSKDRSFHSIPLIELETIKEAVFILKEGFLKLYEDNPELIKLILGPSFLPMDSFDRDAINQEKEVIRAMSLKTIEPIEPFNETVELGDTTVHKSTILDSLCYGNSSHIFSESFSIESFYNLRKDFDTVGAHFDIAARKREENANAIKAFNNARCGKSVIYIEDYLNIVTEGSKLYEYINQYHQEKQQREKAQKLQTSYPKGFEALFPAKDPNTCLIDEVQKILNAEEKIQIKDKIVKEQEKRLKETTEKKQELRELKSCVASWQKPSRSLVNCFSLYYYYPTNCAWIASEDEWDIRYLIWDFKANPNKPQSESEIMSRHKTAMMEIIPDLIRVIDHFFGNRKNKLTLVCIPSSKKIVTQRRYKDLSEELCNATGMANGYDYVNVALEGEARHLGGTNQAQFSIDESFFKDRYVILFDDVITSGAAMEGFKRLLEASGAKVIGGLSIGKTKHERQSQNPIELI